EGAVVAILTGFPEFPWIGRGVAETDRPVGAAVLARALIRARRAIPILPCESHFAPVTMAALRGIGLTPVPEAGVEVKTLQPGDPVCLVEPTDEPVHASRWLATRAPALVVAIERPGQAATGVYHSTSARSVPFSTRPSPDHSRVTQPRPHEARSARQGGACRRGGGGGGLPPRPPRRPAAPPRAVRRGGGPPPPRGPPPPPAATRPDRTCDTRERFLGSESMIDS